MTRRLILILGLALSLTGTSTAQTIAVKTNIVSDVTTTINLGLETSLHPRWTLDISGGYNPWTFAENRKWKHWIVQPEARFWTCGKYDGHFFGLHVHGGVYNIGNLPNSIRFLGSDLSQLGEPGEGGRLPIAHDALVGMDLDDDKPADPPFSQGDLSHVLLIALFEGDVRCLDFDLCDLHAQRSFHCSTVSLLR